MPVWIGSLLGAFLSFLPSLVGRIMLALGIGYVSYTGISTSLAWIKGEVVSNFSAAPTQILNVIYLLKVDVAVSIIFSAIAARLVVQGLTSGALKRFVVK